MHNKFTYFAHTPVITSLEQHWDNKESGRAWVRRSHYEDANVNMMPIQMNTGAGALARVSGAAG